MIRRGLRPVGGVGGRGLAAALPRHGADRERAAAALRRRPLRADVAGRLPADGRCAGWRRSAATAATTSGGPNFAYDLCVRKIGAAERAGLDLSQLAGRVQRRRAGAGRDPGALRRGLRAVRLPARRRFYPCYGLAEATLLVTGGEPGPARRGRASTPRRWSTGRGAAVEHGEGGRELVGCGRAWIGQRVGDRRSARPATRCARGAGGRDLGGRPERRRAATGTGRRRRRAGPSARACAERRRAVPAHRRPRLPRGRRAVRHRPPQGPDHPARPQPLPAGRRADRRAQPTRRCGPGCGAAFAVEVGRRGAAGGGATRWTAGPRRTLARRSPRRCGGAVAEEHEAQVARGGAAARRERAEDVERQGPAPRLPRGLSGRRAARSLAAQRRPARDGSGAERRVRRRTAVSTARPSLALPARSGRRSPALAARASPRAPRIDPGALDPDRPLTGLRARLAGGGRAAQRGRRTSSAWRCRSPTCWRARACSARCGCWRRAGRRSGAMARPPGSTRRSRWPGAGIGELPLSYGQRALWFLDRLAPESAAYNIAGRGRLPRALDPAALRRALAALVDRHPALRTTFADGGRPVRARCRAGSTSGSSVRERGRRRVERGRSCARRLAEEAFRPFDLDADRWSGCCGVLLRHRRGAAATCWCSPSTTWWPTSGRSPCCCPRARGALRSGPGVGRAGLPPRPASYADFARWQAAMLAGLRGERALGVLARARWPAAAGARPADRPAPPAGPDLPRRRGAPRLRPRRSGRAAARAGPRAAARTLFMALLAGFQALLAR